MNRIAKLPYAIALLVTTLVLAFAGTPRAEVAPDVCTLQEMNECNQTCARRGCIGNCFLHSCTCLC